MFTEDTILRMINQAVAFLLKIAGFKKAGLYSEAQQAVDQALELLTGLEARILRQLDDQSLFKLLTRQDRLDIDRLALVADLFKEEGDILAAQGADSAARASYLRALACHLETGFDEAAPPAPDLTEKVEALVRLLEFQSLPDHLLWTLFCYHEQAGGYRKAADAICLLAGRPGLAQGIRPELAAFYERLLALPDAALAEAGMSREEVKKIL
jgi:hypothetical protein